ncbi:MAG: LysM peptidoglycan-binding domain-containing protein [Caldilineaceae bacterium]
MSNLPVNYAPPPEKEEIPVQQKKIRCRQCGRRAYENLVICPHCGRELHPAAPRWLVWGVPAVIAALFLLVLTGVGGGNPVDGVVAGLTRGWSAISAFGAKIEPRITVGGVPNAEPAPLRNEQPQADALVVAPTATAVQAESVAVVNVAVESAQDTQPVVENAQPTPSQDAAGEPAVQIEALTPTATATLLPTNTPEPPTPTTTATNTEEPTAITVSALAASATPTTEQASGQTSLTVSNIRATSVALTKTVIAASPPTTTPTPLATNTLAPTQTSAATNTPLQPASPTATATSSPTPRPTATDAPAFVAYSIRSGDTLLAIADRYDTSVRELMDINGMSEEDVRRLAWGRRSSCRRPHLALARPPARRHCPPRLPM